MILNDAAIVKSLQDGKIRLDPPLDQEHLRPAGVRVHLGSSLLIPQPGQVVDIARPSELRYDQHDLESSPYLLEPFSFVLGCTFEKVQTSSDLLCVLEGRSTIARLGITIHNAASILDGTQVGLMTPVLEISNHGNMRILLRPKLPIGMLCFHQLSDRASKQSHHNQYAHQDNTTPPILHLGATVPLS